jgi:hypothetical protein
VDRRDIDALVTAIADRPALLTPPSALRQLTALRALDTRAAAFRAPVADPAAVNLAFHPPLLTAIQTPRPRHPGNTGGDQIVDQPCDWVRGARATVDERGRMREHVLGDHVLRAGA